MNYGLELTFLPKKTREYTDILIARKTADLFNKALSSENVKHSIFGNFKAKADIFRLGQRLDDDTYHLDDDTYCIEINNDSHLISSHSFNGKDTDSLHPLKNHLDKVYNIAKKLDLSPCIIKKTKNGDIYYPTGGGHIHACMENIFSDTPQYFDKMKSFTRNIWVDYCNRPYIRWLFAEWAETTNSMTGLSCADIEDGKKIDFRRQHDKHSIVNRFQYMRKANINSIEFRFFDMPRNSVDLILQLRFLHHWLISHCRHSNNPKGKVFRKNINIKYFNDLSTLKFAWREISEFLTGLELNPSDYRWFFEENYVRRIKFGKKV